MACQHVPARLLLLLQISPQVAIMESADKMNNSVFSSENQWKLFIYYITLISLHIIVFQYCFNIAYTFSYVILDSHIGRYSIC